MIPYGHQSVDEEDIRAVAEVLRSDWLTQGPKVAEFEQALAAYCGAAHAVVVSNGTAALMAAFASIDISPGDEFITTALTFVATSNAGVWHGARPVFVDIDEETGNLDPDLVEAVITSKTKAIVAVDYAGHPADLPRLRDIADRHKLFLIEDAAHALGASVGGANVGSMADITTFSFHPVKPIATGEGGALLTNDPVIAERARMFRNHGVTREHMTQPSPGAWFYEMQMLGLNYRLTDIQCALGISQLKKIDTFIDARHVIAAKYGEAFRDISSLQLPVERGECRSGWHIYPIRLRGTALSRRAEIFQALRDAGIGVQVHYIPVYWHPYYQKLGYRKGLCPKAEAFYEAEITLPIFPGLLPADQDRVIQTLRDMLMGA